MEFEENLKNGLRVEMLKRIEEDFQRRWSVEDTLEEGLRDIKFYSIENAYSIYMENKMRNIPKEHLFMVCEEFGKAISTKALMEMKGKIELEEREKTYIKYREQCARWEDGRNKSCC